MARPPSQRAHDQAVQAALKLIARDGIDATSMDAIAAESGVSKATLYKHWKNKEELCLEMLVHLDEPMPEFRSGDTRADLVALLRHHQPAQHSGLRCRLMPHLGAYAARNPGFGLALRKRVLEPRCARLTDLLRRAVDNGELRADLNLNLAVALLMGPMAYSHAMNLMKREVPADLAERSVEVFWRAFSLPGKINEKKPAGRRRL